GRKRSLRGREARLAGRARARRRRDPETGRQRARGAQHVVSGHRPPPRARWRRLAARDRARACRARRGVPRRRSSACLARIARDARDRRVPPAGDARRGRSDPRRELRSDDLHADAAAAHRGAGEAGGSGAADPLRHDLGIPRVLRPVEPRRAAARERLYPVGRLDTDSEGLLLLTNDGTWAERVLHPRHGHEREYDTWVEGDLTEEALARLQRGIPLEEGLARAVRVAVRSRSRG